MQNYVIYDNAIVKPVSEIPAEIVKKNNQLDILNTYIHVILTLLHKINNVHFHAQFIFQHFGV